MLIIFLKHWPNKLACRLLNKFEWTDFWISPSIFPTKAESSLLSGKEAMAALLSNNHHHIQYGNLASSIINNTHILSP